MRRHGTVAISSSRAASTRPWPARMRFSPSISTGLVKPKRRMLSAIWRICLRECVRALRGQEYNELMGKFSIRRADMMLAPKNQYGIMYAICSPRNE